MYNNHIFLIMCKNASLALEWFGFQQLINNLDRDLQYAIRVEGKMDLDSVSNYEEVKNAIMEKLIKLRDKPICEECPLIYHLDVAAMYPNIILTNRLQPPSIVTDEVCTACDFNRPGKTCLRKLEWVWRGEIFMAKKSDYYHLKKQIESELVEGADRQSMKSFLDLTKSEQQSRLKERLKKYCCDCGNCWYWSSKPSVCCDFLYHSEKKASWIR